MLAQCDASAAWSWIQATLLEDGNASLDRLSSLDGSLQLAIIDFVLTHNHAHDQQPQPQQQQQQGADAEDLLVSAKRIIAHLLQASRSAVVRFEAARALMLLSLSGPVSPNVVKAVAAVFIELASREADNNAKLMILEKYGQLQAAHPTIVNEDILEVLRILTSASDVTIRQKVLALVSAGVTGRQAAELLGMLVKELKDGAGLTGSSDYRLSILSAMDAIASRFSTVAPIALQAFITLLTMEGGGAGSASASASEVEQLAVIKFIKEHLARTPALISEALPALLDAVPCLSQGRPLAGLLWILGDLGGSNGGASGGGGSNSSSSNSHATAVVPDCREAILARLPIWTGPLPWRRMHGSSGDDRGNDGEARSMPPLSTVVATAAAAGAGVTRKKVNSDGTYATESALTSGGSGAGHGQSRRDQHQPVLRELIVQGGNSLVATALAMMLCKLQRPGDPKEQVMFMLIITSSLKMLPHLDRDTFDRLLMALRLTSGQVTAQSSADAIDLERECHRAFAAYLAEADRARSATRTLSGAAHADERIEFRLASTKEGRTIRRPSGVASTTLSRIEDDVTLAISGASSSTTATNYSSSPSTSAPLANVLATVVQLTGFSDEIYAETYVTISHADIILDILLVNQGDRMLQGVTIELATEGDLQVTEKPPSLLLSPRGFAVTKASLKVRSTNSALIYGCISYAASATDCRSIILTGIPIDVSEYIRAAPLSDAAFRALWPTLEWENKIVIPAIHGLTLSNLMSQLLGQAHLECCTPGYGVNETGDYLAANLHAVSSFGEEILANICLEAAGEAGISGHLRLRSKTQGIAVALGDHITTIVTKLANATGKGEGDGEK